MSDSDLIPWSRSLFPARLMDTHAVTLSGGPEKPTIANLEDLIRETGSKGLAWPAKLLFALRSVFGLLFGWDKAHSPSAPPKESYFWQMDEQERELCPSTPGEMKGPGRVLWNTHRSIVLEVLNKTCHAFAVAYLEGDQVKLSVFVIETKWWSKYYLSLIEPFRKYIVYPALVAWLEATWQQHHLDPEIH